MTQEKQLYTVREFCDAHGIGRTTFYAEVNEGRLQTVKVGAGTRVTRAEAMRWVASLPAASAAA